MESTSKKTLIIKLIVVCIILYLFQFIYLKGLEYLLIDVIAKVIKGLTNSEYLVIHHIIMFIILFIPTFILHKKKKLDFGYRKVNMKESFSYLIIISIFGLTISLITAIMGDVSNFSLDEFIFQLFFSGLGEEILFRSIPLIFIPLFCKKDIEVNLKKYKINVSVIISSILFALAHISITRSGISYSFMQLICCLITGIILGLCYKKTNNIWLCMILHGLYNVLTFTFNIIFGLF